MKRECGDCQLCCRLLAVIDNEPWRKGKAIDKPAGVRCEYQKHRKGCSIYADRPYCCKVWNCRWLVSDDTADQARPDRSHLVIDVMPDYVTLRADEGEPINLQVVQVWCDPRFRDAHKDPAFRKYVERRGAEGIGTLIRYSTNEAVMLIPPNLAPDGQWHENLSTTGPARTPQELAAFMEGAKIVIGAD